MKIPLFIEKEDTKDCGFDCPFRSNHNELCLLFNQKLEKDGYYDSYSLMACESCQNIEVEKEQGHEPTN